MDVRRKWCCGTRATPSPDEVRMQDNHQGAQFYHKLKDPVKGTMVIDPDISLIIIEGNWLLYNKEPWDRISEMVDDTWLVDVDPELAQDRVVRRHLQAGIESTWEAVLKRASGNDLLNGEEVGRMLVQPAVVVQSADGLPLSFFPAPGQLKQMLVVRENTKVAERVECLTSMPEENDNAGQRAVVEM